MRAYYGRRPDTFKDESEVVLTGQLSKTEFHATEMTAMPVEMRRGPAPFGHQQQPSFSGQTGGSKWDRSATCC